jgi:hypothetical protein
VVRGWSMIALIVAVAVRLSYGAVADAAGGTLLDLRPVASILFITVVCWLSVLTTAMGAIYMQYDRPQMFRNLFIEHPLNLVATWAAFGFVVIGATLWTAPMGETGVRENPALVTLVLTYLVASAVVAVGVPTGHMMRNPSAWLTVLLFVGLLRSITHPEMATNVVSGEAETARIEGFRSFDIPRGIYVIEDEKAHSSMELFSELVTTPLRPDASGLDDDSSASATLEFLIPRGLMVTRDPPDMVKERYQLQVTPMIWLTESPGDLRIQPTSLAILTDTMTRFMESNPNGIILLTGMEYLVTFNDFTRLLRSLDTLSETVWITRTRLLIGIDPRAFDDKELALLERDKNVVKGRNGIAELKRESGVMRDSG